MVTYKKQNDDIVSISSISQLCEVIYENEISVMDTNDEMAYTKIYSMLSQEEVVFFDSATLADLATSIGVSDTDYSNYFSIRYERNIFVLSFLIRTFIAKRNKTYALNDDVIFASIKYHEGIYTLILGALEYSQYPQLKPWLRKITIEKLLKEI